MRRQVVLFARAPVPGRTKTRLAASIGDRDAAAVAAALLRHALGVVSGSSGWGGVLSWADDPARDVDVPHDLDVEQQSGGGLGRRMADAFARHFAAGAEQVVLVGSDVPALGSRHLAAAFALLEEVEVVLGPAADGGYWLVGQRAPCRDLFTGVQWSSDRTLAMTRRRLSELGAGWGELETLRDLDTVEDLRVALETEDLDPGLRGELRGILLR